MRYKEFGDDLNSAVEYVFKNFNSGNKATVKVSGHDFKLNPVSLYVSGDEVIISPQKFAFNIKGNTIFGSSDNKKFGKSYVFEGIVSHFYRSGKFSDDIFDYRIIFVNEDIDETSIDIGSVSNIFSRLFGNPITKFGASFFESFLFTAFSEINKNLNKVVIHAERVFNDDKSWRNAGYLILSKAILVFSIIAKKQ